MTRSATTWLRALDDAHSQGIDSVLVIVVDVEGSAPRDVGTRMLVTASTTSDTIGGGALEHEAIIHARELLQAPDKQPLITTRTLTLGKDLSQCCGGRVTVQFDIQCAPATAVAVYGAGHVAQQLALLLSRTGCRATIQDNRAEWLARIDHPNVVCQTIGNNPYASIEALAPGTHVLIMTHSHDLDFELVEAAIGRDDLAYCGLIASKSKASRFRSRLKAKGFNDQELERLTAPIGMSVAGGKRPMEVAIAAMSDIFSARNRAHRDRQVDVHHEY